MITSIADTSFVVALGNAAEKHRAACEAVKRGEEIIVLPQTVLAEVGYLFTRRLGNRAMAKLLTVIAGNEVSNHGFGCRGFHSNRRTAGQICRLARRFRRCPVAALAERL